MTSLSRVAITGLGAVCSIGRNSKESWENSLKGTSGIKQIKSINVEDLKVTIAGEVKDFTLSPEILSEKDQKRYDIFTHFALAASEEAIQQSNLKSAPYSADRIGCIIASGMGGIPMIEESMATLFNKGPRRVMPFAIPGTIPNMASGLVSIRHKLQGTNFAVSSACASSGHAIGMGMMEIQLNRQDAVIVGGAEGIISRFTLAGFASMKALSKRNEEPEKASRPFDTDRDGFVMGDGAAILILENLEKAKARGATILAELVGFGASSDAYHVTAPAPDGSGAKLCMKAALENAQLSPTDIDHVNAHGTSTPLGDVVETKAIKEVFGEHAKDIVVCSTKSMTGHMLGAAAAIESFFCVNALKEGKIPPTINLDNPDPECDLNYNAHKMSEKPIRYALNNSFGFGGTNTCLIFKKWDGQ